MEEGLQKFKEGLQRLKETGIGGTFNRFEMHSAPQTIVHKKSQKDRLIIRYWVIYEGGGEPGCLS